MNDAERKKIARKAVRDALENEARKIADDEFKFHVAPANIKAPEAFANGWSEVNRVLYEHKGGGRGDVRDLIASLMVERDEWKRRAIKHGYVEDGDEDCA